MPEKCPTCNGTGKVEKSPDMAADFERFWRAYPRKEAKQPALKAFWKMKPSPEMLEDMLEWLEKAKQSEQWQDRSKIPHPATWLNQRRWEGDVPPRAGKAVDPVPAPPDPDKAHDDAQRRRALAEAAVRDRQRERDSWDRQKAVHEHTARCREDGACPYHPNRRPVIPDVDDVLRRMR